MRKEIDKELGLLGTQVGQLEAEYIEKQHAVSNDFATLQGFVAADKKFFIRKTEDTLVLNVR